MGYPVDIFTSSPPESCICAICTDVFKDAVAFKECGHTFCNECATACLPSEKCPTCRAFATGFIPSFIVRELVGSMEVQCPSRNCDGTGDQACKRSKGNEGESVTSIDGCCWSGKCQDLQNHEDVCHFKLIKCSIDGCKHECQRKDMSSHLSGEGFLQHMNLMKQSIEGKRHYEQEAYQYAAATGGI